MSHNDSTSALPEMIPPIHARRRRGRDINEPHRTATPLELLFDLVVVIAIALVSSQLHHGATAHPSLQTFANFAISFFGIWWAWMNYTWFASAYDNDDVWFRCLTMLQMVGTLIFATGIPLLFQGQWLPTIVGFVVMRLALVIQWLRAAEGDPERRKTCLRYALGIFIAQIGWCLRYFVPVEWMWPSVAFMICVELAVPIWAEQANITPWHAHHIAERYSSMTIIALGECMLGIANSVANILSSEGWTWQLASISLGGMALIFCLWWMYFLLPSAKALHEHRERSFYWGYGHYFLFAAIAAMGSSLEVVADIMNSTKQHVETNHHAPTALFAISFVAATLVLFVFSLWALWRYLARSQSQQLWIVLLNILCAGGVVYAVSLGLPIALAIPLLCIGPIITIAYNEYGNRFCEDRFSVR